MEVADIVNVKVTKKADSAVVAMMCPLSTWPLWLCIARAYAEAPSRVAPNSVQYAVNWVKNLNAVGEKLALV